MFQHNAYKQPMKFQKQTIIQYRTARYTSTNSYLHTHGLQSPYHKPALIPESRHFRKTDSESSPSLKSRLLVVRRERVVRRAEVGPRLGHGVRGARVGRVLGHDDGEAGLEVEVDVAVEEPRARVVGLEADRDVVARGGRARRHDVAPDRVVVVVYSRACAADDGEGVL